MAARDEPLTLNCKAAGRPSPEIQWYHNGTPLVPSERRVVLPEGSLFFLRYVLFSRIFSKNSISDVTVLLFDFFFFVFCLVLFLFHTFLFWGNIY